MRFVLLVTAVLVAAVVVPTTPHAQGALKFDAPKFAVDPTWPKDLPKDWITGQLGGVCVDSRDNVYVVNRRNITDEEKQTSISAPSKSLLFSKKKTSSSSVWTSEKSQKRTSGRSPITSSARDKAARGSTDLGSPTAQ